MPEEIGTSLLLLLLAFALILVNAFFVAAEFALVKIRRSRMKVLVRKRRPFAGVASWLVEHLQSALSACQLGITMTSLGLGWVGEPALASLIRPLFASLGIHSTAVLHSFAFTLAFTVITALHIVVGEQAPKMLAIAAPEAAVLTVSFPLRIFYLLTYPFMWLLNKASNAILALIGVHAEDLERHEVPFSEEELRALLATARRRGEIKKSTYRLLEAAFGLEKSVARQVMVPRTDVVFFRTGSTLEECLECARRTKHTRFPLCRRSLDDVVGVVHIKDLLSHLPPEPFDLEKLARPPRMVPETLSLSSLLKLFQASRQHLFFVLDEHGAVQGIVTLENVIEALVGELQDEFDEEEPDIVPDGPGSYVVSGSTPLELLNRRLGLSFHAHRVDTLSGLLFKHAGRVLKAGDRIRLAPGVVAEVLEVRSSRAWKIRLHFRPPPSPSTEGEVHGPPPESRREDAPSP